MDNHKIIFAGPVGAGKTTAIASISDIEPVSTDEVASDMTLKRKGTTTVALDYGVIADDRVDLIYANPYDAAMLVREKGFRAVAKPLDKSDEAVIAVNAEHPARYVEDLGPGIRVAATDDPDVRMMDMIMLEPADLHEGNITQRKCDSYILVAKELLNGNSDAGFFLADAFANLSGLVRNQLRPLVASRIQVIHHSLMAGPKLADRHNAITKALLAMGNDAKGKGVLEGLGIDGWSAVEQEEVEFMIDLMDTLAE